MKVLVLVAAGYALASLVTFATFALDKRASTRGQRRTPELRLHLFEALGGWPGAILGIHSLRHKSSKSSFYLATYGIACLHIAAWALIGWLSWSRV